MDLFFFLFFFFYKIRYFDSLKLLHVSCESDSIEGRLISNFKSEIDKKNSLEDCAKWSVNNLLYNTHNRAQLGFKSFFLHDTPHPASYFSFSPLHVSAIAFSTRHVGPLLGTTLIDYIKPCSIFLMLCKVIMDCYWITNTRVLLFDYFLNLAMVS